MSLVKLAPFADKYGAGVASSFQPHPLIRGGHLQTLAGAYLPGPKSTIQSATQHHVELPDGDVVVVHDNKPSTWTPGDRAALLMHGLSGCHGSGYMIRIADRLWQNGVRSFRMDHRGCGAGRKLARNPFNAGRSDDARCVVSFLERLCAESTFAIAGFSLSGNILLKMLGEAPADVPDSIGPVVAVNPPIDLYACVRAIETSGFGIYDRYFARRLYDQVKNTPQWREELLGNGLNRPRSLFEFDDRYTGPASGFLNAVDYYSHSSANQFLSTIRRPVTIVTARDDPMVPAHLFHDLPASEFVTLQMESAGGHMGYIDRRQDVPARRWLVECVSQLLMS